jgi:HEAT repeat protein
MPVRPLHDLLSAPGLLHGGGAAGRERLRRLAPALRRLAAQAPAVRPLADAAARALAAPGVGPLLDLGLLLRQARAALAGAGAGGEISPVGPSGPWATATPAGEAYALAGALTAPDRTSRELLAGAAGRGRLRDLRLVDPLLGAVDAEAPGDIDFGYRAATELFPAFGPALVPEVRRRIDPHCDWRSSHRHGWRLGAVCRIDRAAGAAACRALLAEGSPEMQKWALYCLPDVLPAAEAARIARERLTHAKEASVRIGALYAVEVLGPAARDAVPALVRCLEDANEQVRWFASNALRKVGAAAAPALVEALKDPRVAPAACMALSTMGAGAAPAVPAVVELLQDEGSPVFLDALRALHMGPAARAAAPAVLRVLRSKDASHRAEAVRVLGAICARGQPVWEALRAALADRSAGVRGAAVEALVRLGGAAEAVPELTRLRKDKVGYVRRAAASALEALARRPATK